MAATSPEACDELFERHLNAGDLDALVALYEESATLLPEPGVLLTGRSAIREALSAFVAAGAQVRMTVTQVVRAGDDLAVLYNDWSGTAKNDDGERVSIAGQAIEVVRRQADGGWLFAVDDPYGRG
jgi:uncharacterized protein (TIGR02246 family)